MKQLRPRVDRKPGDLTEFRGPLDGDAVSVPGVDIVASETRLPIEVCEHAASDEQLDLVRGHGVENTTRTLHRGGRSSEYNSGWR